MQALKLGNNDPHIVAADGAQASRVASDGTPAAAPAERSLLSRLAGGTFNYGVGQVLPQVISFLLIPVYTAFLSPEDYGILDLAASLGAVVVLLMRFGVPGSVTRFYFDYKEGQELSDYVTTIARSVNVISLVIGGLMLLAAPWTIVPWTELQVYPYVLLVVVIQLLSSNSDLQRRLIQAREQSAYSAVLSLAIALVNIAMALLFVVALQWGAVGKLLAEALCGVVFLIQALYYLWPSLGGRFRREMLRSSIVYGLGILPSHLLSSISPLLVRIILAHVNSLTAVGVLGLATRMASPLTMVLVSAFNMAYLPLYFSIRKEATPTALDKLAATSRHVWLVALFCFLGLALLAPPAIVLMTPVRFHEAAPLVPILGVGFLAQTLYTLLGPEIFYAKRTWLVPFVSAAGLTTTLALSAALVGQFGAMGIAWATSLGLVAAMITASYFSRQTVRVPHDWLGLLRAGAVAVAVFFAAYWAAGSELWTQVAAGLVALVVFPLLLWLVGDQATRETWDHRRSLLGSLRK